MLTTVYVWDKAFVQLFIQCYMYKLLPVHPTGHVLHVYVCTFLMEQTIFISLIQVYVYSM